MHTGGAPNNRAKSLYRITEDWDESSVTWNNQPDFSSTAAANNTNTSVSTWEDYDITESIKDIVENGTDNFGFILKFPSETSYKGARIRSSEYNTQSQRPKLVIEYTTGDTEPPEVTITSPNGEEILQVGTTHTIRWIATDNVGVVSRSIYFNSGDGNWILIDSALGNTGTYQWNVPDITSINCSIQVNAYDAAGNRGTDESDADFAIEPATEIGTKPFFHSKSRLYHVSIMDIRGRLIDVFTINNYNDLNRIGVLPSGVHIVHITTPENKLIRKFNIIR